MENIEENQKATDMEMALFLAGHIKNPCEDLQGHNIRDFYIREAKKIMKSFKDTEAKKLLEDIIKIYSK